MPEISIITPVYNSEKYIDRCVESILKQTFQDLELILVDDGSTDGSYQKCKEWAKRDSRVRLVQKKNGGAGSARNCALKLAAGNYIGFVDSDDWVQPETYDYLRELMVKHGADIVVCGYHRSTRIITNIRQPREKIEVVNQKEALERYFFRIHGEPTDFYLCDRLIKKEVLSNFKFVEGTICEDVNANYCFYSCADIIVKTNRKLYNYYTNRNSVTYSRVTNKDVEYIDVWRRIRKDLIKRNKKMFLPYCRTNYLRAHFTILCRMLMYGYDKNDKDMQMLYDRIKRFFKSHYIELFRMRMPLSRKLLLVIVRFVVCIK